jgi:DNA-binding response OmpR family regulator
MSSSSSTTRILGPSLTPYSYSQADRIPAPAEDDPLVARILIIEPHADIRTLFEHVVRRAGHEPVVAEINGSGAPDVDAAVIEPGDSQGLAVARLLRGLGRPVVFTSIFPAEQEMLDLEPAAYVVKPVALIELEHALDAALGQAAPA